MMWKEFEEIAGYEVSYKTYSEVIEPMYMALPDSFTKQDFVKMLDKKAFALPTKAEMKRKMRKIANHLYEICGRCHDFEAEQELDRMAKQYAKRFYGLDWAHDLESWVYFDREYEYPEIQRGCTYPATLKIGRGYNTYEEIILIA